MNKSFTEQFTIVPKLMKICNGAVQKLVHMNHIVETVSGKWPEILVMVFYTILHMVMYVFHEPWFDEAEAWQIARCTTLKTLLFETTHYEGHPPLWHLVLKPFAKLGAPYELSLALVSLIFAGGAVYLIVMYSPFPRLVKLLIPFTYFLFYQYGVVSRVYCLMTLEFVLLAMAYQKKDEKPWRYVTVLMLLCTTHAYGLAIAGGLAVCWLFEMWNGQNLFYFMKVSLKDKRIWWLLGLLIVAIGVLLQIMPKEDTYATIYKGVYEEKTSFIMRIVYTFFILLPDTMLTNVFSEEGHLYRCTIYPMDYVSGVLIGLLLLTCIYLYGKKKKTVLLFFVPYVLFAVLSAYVYMATHHIGIGLQFLIFWFWVSGEKVTVEKRQWDSTLYNVMVILTTMAIVVSMGWTVAACVIDIKYVYAVGRTEAQFIKEHHLEQYHIMAAWLVEYDSEQNLLIEDTNHCNMTANIAPYFEHNLFYNYNDGRDDRNYNTHIASTKEEVQEAYARWKKVGKPDIFMESPAFEKMYTDEEFGFQEYALIYCQPNQRVWKANYEYHTFTMYMRRDLLEESGLEELTMQNGIIMQK